MRKLQAAWLQEVRFFQEMVLFSKKKKKKIEKNWSDY